MCSVIFVFLLFLEDCDGPNAALQGPAQEQFLGAFTLAIVAHFSAGSDGGGDGLRAVILSTWFRCPQPVL